LVLSFCRKIAYDGCCGYCGVRDEDTGGEFTVDHFVPSSQGGDDAVENLVNFRRLSGPNKLIFADWNVCLTADQPSESNSGRYWYNLHVVLVVADRARIRNEADFAKLDRTLVATATKHQDDLAARA